MSDRACMLEAVLPDSLLSQAAKRHALLTRSEIVASAGRNRMEHLTKTGRLVRVQYGVYRIAGAPVTWRQQLLAAVLSAGQGAVAALRSAAALKGLERYEPDMLEIMIPRGRRVTTRAIVHTSTTLPSRHIETVDGIPTTSTARTLFDLTAVRPVWASEQAVDMALSRKLTSLRELERVYYDLAKRGRRRCTIMRAILDARDLDIQGTESPKEHQVAQALVRAGLPRPVIQHTVRIGSATYRLDLAYPEERIAIEYDGWIAHSTRSAFDQDRARQNRLSLTGWRILRFTSATSEHMMVRDVRDALELVSALRSISA